jgi:hypothetical protein
VTGALADLARTLREEGGLLAETVRDPGGCRDDLPRAFAAIREGYLLHYGQPRIVSTADTDLALLAGDRLYALGLAELAAAGDLEAVAVMAEVIAASAAAHGAGDPAAAQAAWAACVPIVTERMASGDR